MTAEQFEENKQDYLASLQTQYDICIAKYDRPTIKVLAGILRNLWDMRMHLDRYLSANHPTVKFPGFTITCATSNIVRGHEYIIVPFPSGIRVKRTTGITGILASDKPLEKDRPFYISCPCRVCEDGALELRHYAIIYKMPNVSDYQALGDNLIKVESFRYLNWLDNIVVRLSIPNEAGVLTTYSIKRGDFIDRASNLLGGTHPIGNKEFKRDTNWPVKHLMTEEILDAPLSYTILLKIAQDILTAFNSIK